MANPANILPPQYDDIHPRNYDPAFTADISTKMRVPHRISIIEGGNERDQAMTDLINAEVDIQRNANMSVPDKIVVMGQEQHEGRRADLQTDNLTLTMTNSMNEYVGLSTPPRTLTLEDRPFPMVGEDSIKKKPNTNNSSTEGHNNGYNNGYVAPYSDDYPGYDTGLDTSNAPGNRIFLDDGEDDLLILKRQVAKLSRHVIRLEDENQKRKHWEMVMYPLVFGYTLYKILALIVRGN